MVLLCYDEPHYTGSFNMVLLCYDEPHYTGSFNEVHVTGY